MSKLENLVCNGPMKFVIHGVIGVDLIGMLACTILSAGNLKIIDREILENTQSYKLSKKNHESVIQPTGMLESFKESFDGSTLVLLVENLSIDNEQ